jgi:hypothetical protein
MGDHDPVHAYWPKCDRVPFPPATSRLHSGQSRGRVVAIAASYNSGTETPEGLIEELISLRLPEVNLFAHHQVSDNPIDPRRSSLIAITWPVTRVTAKSSRHGLVMNCLPRSLP